MWPPAALTAGLVSHASLLIESGLARHLKRNKGALAANPAKVKAGKNR